MNENINLCEILEDCQDGMKFYSPFLGEVTFISIDWIYKDIEVSDSEGRSWYIQSNGRMSVSCVDFVVRCTDDIMLFPSKDQRDWSKWKCPESMSLEPRESVPRFDPKFNLRPFEQVLCRTVSDDWECAIFSHMRFDDWEADDNAFLCVGNSLYKYAIPYNSETKHLLGTKKRGPEYYRYWEESAEKDTAEWED